VVTSFLISLAIFGVTEPPPPASIEVFTTMTGTSSSALLADRRDAIRTFLADRVRDAFGLELGDTPDVGATGRNYAITLHFERDDAVLVEISARGELLASRELPTTDLPEACASVWMLVRSTIERNALESPPEEPEPEPEPEPAPAIPPTPTATIAPALDEPAAPAKRNNTTRSALASAPFGARGINSMTASLTTEAAIHGGFGAGPAAAASLELDGGLIVGAGLAYRAAEPVTGLQVRHFPLSFRAGYLPDKKTRYELGASLSLDLAVASTPRRTVPLFGVQLGPYVRGRLPLTTWEGTEVSITAEMGIAVALLRSSYFVAGAEHTDGLFSARALGGVEWRWR
jgi:hypothetical protein